MLLSVIVIAYNAEEFIGECLDSILKQTFSDFELIIVDDGSTDATAAICEKYAQSDSRIRIIRQTNQGMSKARYSGFINARGDYVTFVDSDDKLMPKSYEIALSHLAPEVDLIAYGCVRWYTRDTGSKSSRFANRIPAGIYDRERLYSEVYPRMLWNSAEGTVFDLDPSLCFKIMRREPLGNAMELTKGVAADFGEDVVRIYTMMKFVRRMVVLDKCLYFHRGRMKGIVPPYIAHANFFSNLFSVYECLSKNLDFHPSLREQLDFYFMTTAGFKKWCYNENKPASRKNSANNHVKWLFPFQLVPANSRIALYGAGQVGKDFYAQILRTGYCKVALWVDRAWQQFKEQDNEMEISPVESLRDASLDKIVVCNARGLIRREIYKDLIELGVEKDKIVMEIA